MKCEWFIASTLGVNCKFIKKSRGINVRISRALGSGTACVCIKCEKAGLAGLFQFLLLFNFLDMLACLLQLVHLCVSPLLCKQLFVAAHFNQISVV